MLRPEHAAPAFGPLAAGGRGSLYLHGMPSTGKTHAACAIGFESCEKYVTRFWAARQLKSTMQAAALGEGAWPDLLTPDLLIIDDLDKLKGSEFVYEWLFDLIERRLTGHRGTIVTSQFAPGLMARRLAPDGDDGAAPLASRLGAGRGSAAERNGSPLRDGCPVTPRPTLATTAILATARACGYVFHSVPQVIAVLVVNGRLDGRHSSGLITDAEWAGVLGLFRRVGP